MAKLRVYQLARELNRDNAEVIRELQHMGVPVTSHSNTVEDRLADQLRKKLGVLEIPEPESVEAPPAAPAEEPVQTVAEEKPKTSPEAPAPPPAEVRPAAQPDVQVEAREPQTTAPPKPEPKVEPKPEEVAEPKPPARPAETKPERVTAEPKPEPPRREEKPTPPPTPQPTKPAPGQPILKPGGGRIIPPPTRSTGPRIIAPPPPKPQQPTEERRTMQQIAHERLRQQHRLPPQAPGQRRPGAPGRPGMPGRPSPGGPSPGSRTPMRPGMPGQPAPPVDRRRPDSRHGIERPTRYERQAEKRLSTPYVRPQPKPEAPREYRKITLTEGVTVGELAERLEVKTKDLIKRLMERNVLATINQPLDKDTATQICKEYNADCDFVTFEESVMLDTIEVSTPEKLEPRAPVVTIMGHVDHGKTSLLDAIRKTRVTETEHGGITQHIGAYQVMVKDRRITFLDTPGHEAFTQMRSRGAAVTDIVILVVAADDGVMPQTIESISHTKAAKVPIVVAINKIDKPGANPERVKRELAEKGLQPEEWGGDTVMVEVSAKTGQGLDQLLEMLLLVADIRELKADPTLPAMGTVLEAKVDKGRGNVATVLVQSGTLHVGDNFLVGAVYGKVRALFDEHGRMVKEAGPSVPVEVTGLQGLPNSGDNFHVIEEEKARQIAQYRQDKLREGALAGKSARLTLDQLHQQLSAGEIKEVQLILKCDVQGSLEALTDMLNKLSTDKVKVRIMHSSVGAISETDVLLAATYNAIIIGFNVRPERKAAEMANREKVDIRLHTVIYNVVDEIKRAMAGVLEPVIKENYLGTAEVRETFRIPKVGTIAGCYVTDGKITRNAEVRLLRDNVVIFQGRISSLKRFKDDASEVGRGYECGIGIHNFNDVKVGDSIEAFVTEKVMADVGT